MYIYNGTVYLVSDEPDTFPDRKYMTSAGINIDNNPEMVAARQPTDKDMRIISTSAARKLFGTGANRIQGVTVRAFDVQLVMCIPHVALVARQRSPAIVSTLLPLLTRYSFTKRSIASHIIIIGLPSSFLAFGAHTPRSTHLSPQAARRSCHLRDDYSSPTSMQTIGVTMPQ
jgi:hypothetical protein